MKMVRKCDHHMYKAFHLMLIFNLSNLQQNCSMNMGVNGVLRAVLFVDSC